MDPKKGWLAAGLAAARRRQSFDMLDESPISRQLISLLVEPAHLLQGPQGWQEGTRLPPSDVDESLLSGEGSFARQVVVVAVAPAGCSVQRTELLESHSAARASARN